MELKMGYFVMMQSILCAVACVPHSPCPRKANSSFCLRYKGKTQEEEEAGTIFEQIQTTETPLRGFTLLLLLQIQNPPNLVYSKSALAAVWAALSFRPRRSSLETEGDENHFSFPLLRLIHSFHCGKSSKIHVQHELPFIWSYLQSVVLPPEMTCCSATLQPRGSARNLISCMTLRWGPNVIKRQHRSRLNEQVNEGNEWECFTLKSLINLAFQQLLLSVTPLSPHRRPSLCWPPGAIYPQALSSWGN